MIKSQIRFWPNSRSETPLNKPNRVVAIIPARGGSKSIIDKNIRDLGGKPLIAWSILVAQQVAGISRVIVSTDSERIGAVARQYGAEVYMRPAELAQDHSLVIDAIKDLHNRLTSEGELASAYVLLEPTCPLRAPQDVSDCMGLVLDPEKGLDAVATFVEAEVNPYRTWKLEGERPTPFISGADPWTPRQKLPKAYQLNGAVYAFKPQVLQQSSGPLLTGRTASVVMPAERSVDIDTWLDFAVAEAMLQQRKNNGNPPHHGS